jgi:phage recombination protein Bet
MHDNNQALTLSNNIDIWTDESKLHEIRRLVSPNAPLTDLEFSFLVKLGQSTNLNPFLKEIWVVKYKQGSPAQIFIGRDGYRKAAQRQDDYEYHQVNAVYSEDDFKVINDEIHHSHGFTNRGTLLGAYCKVKRRDCSRYTYVMVTMEEYNLNQGLWKTKPETMICKVAEAQAIRQNFQEVFAGTYSDSEIPQKPNLHVINGGTQIEKLSNILDAHLVNKETGEIMDKPTNNFIEGSSEESINEEQMAVIDKLINEKQLSEERIKKAFDYYKVDEISELNDAQARKFIFQLERI